MTCCCASSHVHLVHGSFSGAFNGSLPCVPLSCLGLFRVGYSSVKHTLWPRLCLHRNLSGRHMPARCPGESKWYLDINLKSHSPAACSAVWNEVLLVSLVPSARASTRTTIWSPLPGYFVNPSSGCPREGQAETAPGLFSPRKYPKLWLKVQSQAVSGKSQLPPQGSCS